MNDPLSLSNSDHPGAQLVTNVFNGANFLSWSRGIKMALGAKQKIGFIDGSVKQAGLNPTDLQKWNRCDFMIRCWILNSMAPNLFGGFSYAETAKQLWNEVLERYAPSNGPLLYQLKRNLSNVEQGNMAVVDYFNQLKKLWDEILSLDGKLRCDCGAMAKCTCNLETKVNEKDDRDKMIHFLMGLNGGYESVRNQILATEPLPSLNKAFYQQVDKKSTGDSSNDSNALFANKPTEMS